MRTDEPPHPPVTDSAQDTARDASVAMGPNDARACAGGWSPPRLWRRGRNLWLRWLRGRGRLRLRAPAGTRSGGLMVYAPGRRRVTLRFTVRNPIVGPLKEYGPYLNVGFAVAPRVWQALDAPFPIAPQGDEEVEVIVALDPPLPGPLGWLPVSHRRLAVRAAWLRSGSTEPTDVTIVVLNWKRAGETITCLESLAQANLRGAAVLVVDNGSGDGSVERIRARFPAQRIVELPENRGYAGGNNAGIRAALDAGAKAVLLLNNDTRVAPDFLDPLLWELNAHAKVAAVSSAILRMDHPDILDVAFLSIYFGHGIVRHHGVNALPGQGFSACIDVDVAVGCSVLLNAEALRDIGPLDEAYFAYHEEVDWCFRARQAGYRILYQPLSRVFHGGSQSTIELAEPLHAERARAEGEQLPMAIPLSWNPVRTYLGARNTVRFVRNNGTPRQQFFFLRSSLYSVPLEALAAVMRQEPALKIGAWSYRTALALYCAGPGATAATVRPGPLARELLHLPRILAWSLPRDIRLAYREGRLAQIFELLRGLWDGVLDRPLPLERLKLR